MPLTVAVALVVARCTASRLPLAPFAVAVTAAVSAPAPVILALLALMAVTVAVSGFALNVTSGALTAAALPTLPLPGPDR